MHSQCPPADGSAPGRRLWLAVSLVVLAVGLAGLFPGAVAAHHPVATDDPGAVAAHHPVATDDPGTRQSGSIDLQDDIRPGTGTFDVTVGALDNVSGSAWLRVTNADNTALPVEQAVEQVEVLTLSADDIGGFQGGDSIEATLAASSDFVNVLDTDQTTVAAPNLQIQSVSAPDTVPVDQALAVDYTLANVGSVEGTERFVDLQVEGTNTEFDDTDENVTVPAGGTTSGTLTFDSVDQFFAPGNTIDYVVSLFEFGDSQGGTTTVQDAGSPDIVIDSLDFPASIAPDDPLDVGYTLANNGSDNGTEDAVRLFVGDTAVDADTDVTVPAGGTVDGTLTFQDQNDQFGDGDTIQFAVELETFGDVADGATDVESRQPAFAVDILSTNAPVTEGESLSVEAELSNTGPGGEDTVTLSVGGLGSDSRTLFLDTGVSSVETFTVGTGPGDAGDYVATVESSTSADSRDVTVDAAGGFTVEILDLNEPAVGSDLAVQFEVTNTGSTQDTQTVELTTSTGIGTDSTDVTLVPNESTSGVLAVGTSAGDTGDTVVTVASADDAASADTTVLSRPGFLVNIVALSDPVVGDDIDVQFQVTNVGGSRGTQTVGLTTSPDIGTDATNVTLDPDESTSDVLSVGTGDGDAGEYTLTVLSNNDTASVNLTVLSAARFSVEILDVTQPTAGGDIAVQYEVNNTGDTLDGNESTTGTLTVGTSAGDGGEYVVTVTTADDSASANLTVGAAGEFAVSILDTNSPVVAGESLAVDAEITNTGDTGLTAPVTLVVEGLGTTGQNVTLPGGESTTVSLTLATASGDAGEYTATVSSPTDQDSTPVTVTAAGGFEVSLVGTSSPIEAGATLEVEAEITNTGTEAATQTVSFDAETLGSAERTVSLDAGESTTESFTADTGPDDAGEYVVTVATAEDAASADVTVTGGGGDPAAFDVTIVRTNAPVEEGETVELEVNITNTGAVEDTQTVTVDVGALGTVEATVTLAAGASTTRSFSVRTGSGDAGEYPTSVTTATDQDSTDLSVAAPTATFEVTVETVTTPPDGDGEFQATVSVQNADEFEDTQTITLSSNGTRGSQSLTLAGGGSATLAFTWNQTVDADGEVTLDVEAASETDTDSSSTTVGGGGGGGGVSTTTGLLLLLLLIVLVAVYYYVRRRQLSERNRGAGGPGDTGDGGDDSGTDSTTGDGSGGDSVAGGDDSTTGDGSGGDGRS
jgi:hypothetical protein